MTFSYSKLKKIAFLLLALPTLVFVVGFLRWWVAVPVAALLTFAYVWSIRREKEEERRRDEVFTSGRKLKVREDFYIWRSPFTSKGIS